MDGERTERERVTRDGGEREGLFMTPSLEVWVSIFFVSSHHVGITTGGNSSREQWRSFSEKLQLYLRKSYN